MKKILCILSFLILIFTISATNNTKDSNSVRHYKRWSQQKINSWYSNQKWQVGFNYVPSNKVNQIDMWQAESYDHSIMEKELAMGEKLGFNVVRIFLHDLVYFQDPIGFKARFEDFLKIANKNGMKVIPTFFTNGGKEECRKLGKQPDEIKGTHNIHWCKTPGIIANASPEKFEFLKKYVQDVISTHAKDTRILCWYLYNEPWNNSVYQDKNIQDKIDPYNLLTSVFSWARVCGPTQPLTSCMYLETCPSDGFIGENADIITFHCYKGPQILKSWINKLKLYDRPILCGEYMGRPISTFQEIMPILKENNIMAINFGLIAGKAGFYNQWNSLPSDTMPSVWFHDILTQDGQPYDKKEVEFIKQMTSTN